MPTNLLNQNFTSEIISKCFSFVLNFESGQYMYKMSTTSTQELKPSIREFVVHYLSIISIIHSCFVHVNDSPILILFPKTCLCTCVWNNKFKMKEVCLIWKWNKWLKKSLFVLDYLFIALKKREAANCHDIARYDMYMLIVDEGRKKYVCLFHQSVHTDTHLVLIEQYSNNWLSQT